MIKVQFDAEADTLTIDIGDVKGRFHRSERLPFGDLILDVAEDGTVLSFEVLAASRKYPQELLRQYPATYDEPMSLAEAAAIAGTSAQNLRKACESGRLGSKKIGRNWTTTIAAVTEYLDTRKHGGPGSKTATA